MNTQKFIARELNDRSGPGGTGRWVGRACHRGHATTYPAMHTCAWNALKPAFSATSIRCSTTIFATAHAYDGQGKPHLAILFVAVMRGVIRRAARVAARTRNAIDRRREPIAATRKRAGKRHAGKRAHRHRAASVAALFAGDAAAADGAVRILLAAFRARLYRQLPCRLAPDRQRAAQIRGLLRRRVVRGRRSSRRAPDRGAVSPRLRRRQPRALRARSRAVRRAAPGVRQFPLDPRRRWSRHDRARRRRCRGDLSHAAAAGGRARAHRAPLQAVPRRARRADRHRPHASSAPRC